MTKRLDMENQLNRIGMLVLDLKAGKGFAELGFTLEYLEEEFNRISMSLVSNWFLGLPSLSYLLDFHAGETSRLMGSVEELKLKGNPLDADQEDELQLHVCLIRHLSTLSLHLERLNALRLQKPARV